MSLTSLNIQPPTKVQTRPACPCGAGADKRINAGGFGTTKVIVCGECGKEVTDGR